MRSFHDKPPQTRRTTPNIAHRISQASQCIVFRDAISSPSPNKTGTSSDRHGAPLGLWASGTSGLKRGAAANIAVQPKAPRGPEKPRPHGAWGHAQPNAQPNAQPPTPPAQRNNRPHLEQKKNSSSPRTRTPRPRQAFRGAGSSSHFAILFRIPVMVGLDPPNSGHLNKGGRVQPDHDDYAPHSAAPNP